MVPILLALLACAAFGASDYLQGMAARKASSIPVMIVAQNTGLVAILVAAPLIGGTPATSDLIWGTLLGVLLLAGIALLIYAFSHGPVTVAATVIAVIGIALPAGYGLVCGEHLDAEACIGLGTALIAILLINLGKGSGDVANPLAITAAIGCGIAFGGFAIVLSKIGSQAGLWPLVIAYLIRSLLLGLIVLAVRPAQLMRSCRSILLPAGLAGVMVALASAGFLLSLQLGGQLVVVNTISSEAPVVTVALAILILKERVNTVQATGLLAGFASLILIGL